MRLPPPIEAFIALLPEGSDDFMVNLAGWTITVHRTGVKEPGVTGLSAWVPTPGQMPRDSFSGILSDAMKIGPRPLTDVSSLSQPMPSFDEDPLVPEVPGAPEAAPLTNADRVAFAAATAPKPDAA